MAKDDVTKGKKKNADFLIDLPMVFSVVGIDDLIKSANDFYGRNIILPKPGSSFDNRAINGDIHEFHLYKLTIKRLSEDEKSFKKNVSGFETIVEKEGVFSNLYEIINRADSVTIFSNLEDADIFLKAWLKAHSDIESKSAFIYTQNEIEGLDKP